MDEEDVVHRAADKSHSAEREATSVEDVVAKPAADRVTTPALTINEVVTSSARQRI